ncbi:Fe2+-enterobactin ABC transporter substrate-binding protein [Pantoea sp. YU22]|nr:Fe2+-enterobactin ABC transporter substrate-binding protein [Pantoea sp. YU22]
MRIITQQNKDVAVSRVLARRWLLFLTSLLFIHNAVAQDEAWPRQFQDRHGAHTLTKAPQRIVSTSETLTGSLLAIDAPVVASTSTTPSSQISDPQGFFRQWGDIAHQRGVARLGWGEISVERVAMQRPDLILISATGGDSSQAQYDQMAALAPVLVVRYDDKSWQQLLMQLGRITGHEEQAQQRIQEAEKAFEKMKQEISLPAQPVNAMVWDEITQSTRVFTADSAQGQFLIKAGFKLASLPENVQPRATQGKRQDIVQLEGESLVNGLTGKTLLLFAADESDKKALLASPLLAHQPAVKAKQVYAMGSETFRLDYYSAMGLIARMNALFGTKP